MYRRLQAAGIESQPHTHTEFYASEAAQPVISYVFNLFSVYFCPSPILYHQHNQSSLFVSVEKISNGNCKRNMCWFLNGISCIKEANWIRGVWKCDLPIRGTESDVAGMISATSSMKTVSDSSTVMPGGADGEGENDQTHNDAIKVPAAKAILVSIRQR